MPDHPQHRDLDTDLVHAGEPEPPIAGARVLPIVHSSVVVITSDEDYENLGYPRYDNLPNQRALSTKLATLERADDAFVTASGMAAISSGLLAVLGSGDHVLASDCLYGGTHGLLSKRFPRRGIEHDFVSLEDPDAWKAKLRPNTKAFYLETVTNPLLRVGRLEEAVAFAKEHDLVTLIDNTFATPAHFRPAEHGIDLSLHSCTKYLNGHSDLVAGAVIGRGDLVREAHAVMVLFGGSLDIHACSQLHRGMKTLGVRLRRQCETAAALARWLEGHPAVERVLYPGLPSHPDHERARSLLDDFGAMLAFEPAGGFPAARKFLGAVRTATHGPSLGGVETLVVSPARSSHRGLSPEERAAIGLKDSLVRVSVGLESPEALVEDFEQALGGS